MKFNEGRGGRPFQKSQSTPSPTLQAIVEKLYDATSPEQIKTIIAEVEEKIKNYNLEKSKGKVIFAQELLVKIGEHLEKEKIEEFKKSALLAAGKLKYMAAKTRKDEKAAGLEDYLLFLSTYLLRLVDENESLVPKYYNLKVANTFILAYVKGKR